MQPIATMPGPTAPAGSSGPQQARNRTGALPRETPAPAPVTTGLRAVARRRPPGPTATAVARPRRRGAARPLRHVLHPVSRGHRGNVLRLGCVLAFTVTTRSPGNLVFAALFHGKTVVSTICAARVELVDCTRGAPSPALRDRLVSLR